MIPSATPANFDTTAFDRGTAPILQIISTEQVRQLVDYRADEALRQRIDELAAKCNEGELSAAEQLEYEGYVRANKFIAILQAQARKALAAKSE